MTDLQELIELLDMAVEDRARRLEHVKRFQNLVWDSKDLHADPEIISVVRDLAYDLDFYEPDERSRAEDLALYGDSRLEEEIGSALRKLRSPDRSP